MLPLVKSPLSALYRNGKAAQDNIHDTYSEHQTVYEIQLSLLDFFDCLWGQIIFQIIGLLDYDLAKTCISWFTVSIYFRFAKLSMKIVLTYADAIRFIELSMCTTV